MFITIFASAIRCIAIPIVAFLALSPTMGEKPAFLIVTIALTVTNILSIIWQGFRIIPSLMLLRGGKILRIILRIIIEIVSTVGFWIYYLRNYN